MGGPRLRVRRRDQQDDGLQRAEHTVERLQIKWLAAAGALCGALYFVSLVSAALLAGDHGETPGWIAVVQDVWFVCLGLIPIAIGIAVLRYRLFEIA